MSPFRLISLKEGVLTSPGVALVGDGFGRA